jgi:hypothetical protein
MVEQREIGFCLWWLRVRVVEEEEEAEVVWVAGGAR